LLEAKVSNDHLRMLISLKPEQSISTTVKLTKGNLSRPLNLLFPERLEKLRVKSPLGNGLLRKKFRQSQPRCRTPLRRKPSISPRLSWYLDSGNKVQEPCLQVTGVQACSLSMRA
jgi:hypothetical protein